MNETPQFVYTLLEFKLHERSSDALEAISRLSREDILRCDSGCLAQIIREFAVAPPILRTDLKEVDEKIIELEDIMLDRKTGNTGHIFIIPVERDSQWLEEIDNQRTTIDDYPLAFLDKKRSRIRIKLQVSPEDKEGALKCKLDYRTRVVEEYVDSVGAKLVQFNKDLAQKMAAELNKRKSAIIKGHREIENTGLPRVHNPEHEEKAIQIDRLLRNLGKRITTAPSNQEESKRREVRIFIVHGHDHQTVLELKDYLQNTLKLGEPVVLRQMPGLGRTLIEKFEKEAEAVELVFVVLTPDDKAAALNDPDNEKRRARQNVIFELGFFLGKLGRTSGRIILLHKGSVEIPSDVAGIEYIDISNGVESAGEKIRRELNACGIYK